MLLLCLLLLGYASLSLQSAYVMEQLIRAENLFDTIKDKGGAARSRECARIVAQIMSLHDGESMDMPDGTGDCLDDEAFLKSIDATMSYDGERCRVTKRCSARTNGDAYSSIKYLISDFMKASQTAESSIQPQMTSESALFINTYNEAKRLNEEKMRLTTKGFKYYQQYLKQYKNRKYLTINVYDTIDKKSLIASISTLTRLHRPSDVRAAVVGNITSDFNVNSSVKRLTQAPTQDRLMSTSLSRRLVNMFRATGDACEHDFGDTASYKLCYVSQSKLVSIEDETVNFLHLKIPTLVNMYFLSDR